MPEEALPEEAIPEEALPERAHSEPGTVAITGAGGYVGRLLARYFRHQEWDVVALVRHPRVDVPTEFPQRRFVLGEPIDPDVLAGVRTVVHCAYDLKLTDPEDIQRVNVLGTLRLLDAAAAAKVERVVLVSSMSAYPGTRQVYGQSKLAAESAVLEAGGAAVRLGLVYGSGWGGMAGSLRKLLALPVVPLMAANSHQFTVHEDDAAAGLFEIARADRIPAEAVGLAHPEPVGFRRLLDGFALQADIRPRFVPVPWSPVHAGMRVAERIGVPLPLRADSLLGLARPAPFVPGVEEWDRLGVTLRPFTL